MTRLQWFEKYKIPLHHGLRLGLISSSVYSRYLHYLIFTHINRTNMRTKSVQITADLMKCSAATVWNSIDYIESEEESGFSDFQLTQEDSILGEQKENL